MPDMNGSRKILNLKTEEVFDIECTSVETSLEPLTSVGKFHFYTSAFEKANTMLIGTLEHDPRWLVIDEAGKLELEGKGFLEFLRMLDDLDQPESRERQERELKSQVVHLAIEAYRREEISRGKLLDLSKKLELSGRKLIELAEAVKDN